MRLVAVLGGGDWADASVDHINVPDDLDLDAARERWRGWYRNEYLPEHAKKRTGERRTWPTYLDFPTWLVEREGCARAEIEEFET